MKIIYVDIWDFTEDYSVCPKVYGSAPCFARHAKELLNCNGNRFSIVAHVNCFKNLLPFENHASCIGLTSEQCLALQNGLSFHRIVYDAHQADIIVHHCPQASINMEGLDIPLAFWSPCSIEYQGDSKTIKHTLLYDNQINDRRKARHGHTYRVKIGQFVPPSFIPAAKEDFIFQCSRVGLQSNQVHVAQFCLKYGVKGLFAGRITHENDKYLASYIDNKTTFFLGEITHTRNKELCAKARLYTLCQTPKASPFSISAIEALSAGTPICAPNDAAFSYLIKYGVNGFFWNGNNLPEIWEASKNIRPIDCWESAKPWSHTEMVNSFRKAFEEVIKNHLYDKWVSRNN